MAFLDDLPEPGGNYLVRHWRGALPLPIAYWINGILLGLLVSFGAPFLIAYLHEAMDSLQASAILWFAFLPLFLAFWVWTQIGSGARRAFMPSAGGKAGACWPESWSRSARPDDASGPRPDPAGD